VLVNGRIWTGSAADEWVEALSSNLGRITFTGSSRDALKLAGSRTRIIDLAGALVLPGFIDGHTHFIAGGSHLLSVDLRTADTPSEFASLIASHAALLAPGRWITGGDWDHERWPERNLPTRDLIDEFTRDYPVFVTRLDGHMGLANSAALRRAGVTRETGDPPGGTIVRDGSGEPTGIMKDEAMQLINAAIPVSPAEEQEAALVAALGNAARFGVTSVQDISSWSDYELFERFRDSKRLTVRVYSRTPISSWQRQAELVSEQGRGDEWLRLGGIKGFIDGSLGSATALFFEPFDDLPGASGIMIGDNIPEGKIRDNISAADRAGLQCSIHAIGDRANRMVLDYFEEVTGTNGQRDRRFRVEHAQHLHPSDIGRFARLGVIASMQPCHAVDDGRWAEKRLGPVRVRTAYAFRSLLDSGATLAFGSDWYVAPISPILGIHAAVTRATSGGGHPGGWVPEQKMTVREAVHAYTRSCAYAEFAECEKGSLEVGMLADAVALDRDIFRIPPEEIKDTQIVYTIVGGRVVYGD
jgi:predicted amidohydrolase YtcJ